MENKLYSIAELTSVLQLHAKTILRFIHEGKIKARKIGRNWMVHENDLKEYVHGELDNKKGDGIPVNYESIKNRISVSAVIEINEQGSEEATRISNSLLAMMNSQQGVFGKTRFDFLYYPEIKTAKYIIYGPPGFIKTIMDAFETISDQ